MRTALAQALTFHASFDQGPDADFARGDARLYRPGATEAADPVPGLGALALAPGRFGRALEFARERTHTVLYRAQSNVAFAPEHFRGTLSLWMRFDPAAIPGQYCDPLQVTDKDYSQDCLWLDVTKNDTPPDFRLGIFGDRKTWDVKNRAGEAEEFFWRLLKITEPPFGADRWVHVVVTWEGVNTPAGGRGRLYLDGVYRGSTGLIREKFHWEVARTRIRLGIGDFVGRLDDLAFFDRALTADEVGVLHALENGVASLRLSP